LGLVKKKVDKSVATQSKTTRGGSSEEAAAALSAPSAVTTATPTETADLAPVVGANLRRLRTRRGLSLERLAQISGVSRAMPTDPEACATGHSSRSPDAEHPATRSKLPNILSNRITGSLRQSELRAGPLARLRKGRPDYGLDAGQPQPNGSAALWFQRAITRRSGCAGL